MSIENSPEQGMTSRPSRRDLFSIEFKYLKMVDGFNVRYDYGDLNELARSIAENGVKVPLRGYKEQGFYFITDGHRRYRAMAILHSQGIEVRAPFLVETKDYNNEKRTLDLLLTNEGKRLTMLEESEVYARLIGFGWTQTEIHRKTGKSATHISNCVLLMSATTKTKNLIKEGQVSASLVVDSLKENGTKAVEERLGEVIEELGGKKVTRKDVTKSYREINIKVLDKIYDNLESIEDDETNNTTVHKDKLDAVWDVIKHLRGLITFAQLAQNFTKKLK